MKPFPFILLYITLGTLGPASKGLASGQRAGGGKRSERERERGGRELVSENKEAFSPHLVFVIVS